MNTGQLKKILAAAIGSPVVVALASVPGPFGKVAAGVVGAATIYTNWGHAGSAQSLREYLRSVIAPELPSLLTRLEALENPMIKDDIATLEANLPIIRQALAKVISDDDAARFHQLASDSQSLVDGLKGATVYPGSTVTPAPVGGLVANPDPVGTGFVTPQAGAGA